MSRASILRRLKDEDLEAICHMIRRDARPDAEIAAEAARRLGEPVLPMVVTRYRQSKEFRRWLDRWENQDAALKRDLEAQKMRFELVSSLVKNTDQTGLEAVSAGLMARLLTLAAEMSDDELREAAAGQNSWVARVIRAVQQQSAQDTRRKGAEAADVAADRKMAPDEQKKRIQEIFGLA